MNDQHDDEPDEGFDPRLTEDDRQVLARIRRNTAALKAAGQWKNEPMDDQDDKFSGPFGVDKDDNVTIFHTDEEARRYLDDLRREQDRSVEEQLRKRAEGLVIDPEILAAANDLSRVLAKLPPVAAVVFRGADLSDAQLARYQPGALVEERGFLSCTLDPARTTGGNTTFAISSTWAKDVSRYSPRPDDAEVVFDRSTAFRVLEQRRDPGTGRVEIIMEEVPRDTSAVTGPL